ncbi:unnamed protein product [Caenorhabditis auriculariae]|uniref:K Homology domain-containing protein n=1 Tax=Caenorhabditis auriculariae TaxID=2777116 RepID=A0A8S1GT90_9PELO|nr:unnamed protein product [Caenorhabditis auriculariae]
MYDIGMKREHEGDGDDRQGHRNKRSKGDGFSEALANGKFELRLLVSSKTAGGIIGKGGENIRRLRTTFDAQIQVPDSNSPERVVTIVAAPSTVMNIMEEIIPRMDEAPTDKDPCELRLLVHQSHAGALIGRSGAKIKELREKWNVRLKIFGVCCPNSTDRVLVTSGEVADCLNIVQSVISELKELPIKGNCNQYSPFNHDPSTVAEYGGFSGTGSISRGGDSGGSNPIRSISTRGGRSGGGSWNGSGGSSNSRPMRSPPGRNDFPPPQYQFATQGNYAPAPQYSPELPQSGYAGFGGFTPAPITQAQVTIPSDLGGTIIGRGGERIAGIREKSGAQITLDPANGHSERIITITGTQSQIHAAQYLLQQCVRNSQAGRQRYGPR